MGQRVRRRYEGQDHVDDRSDQRDVAQRAEARPLPQRHPQQQHRRPHGDRPGAGGNAGLPGQALMEDVPRIHAQPGPARPGPASRSIESLTP